MGLVFFAFQGIWGQFEAKALLLFFFFKNNFVINGFESMFVSLMYPFQFCPHSCQCTYRATLLCRLLYSRWANLLNSLVRWLILFSFSPHILHISDSDAELKKPCSVLHFTRAILFKPPWRTSELGWIKVPYSCRHERHVIVSVSDFCFFLYKHTKHTCEKTV